MEKAKLADKNHILVYNETTKPKKRKRRDKSDLGPDFVAPDGGWGWVVCLAAGLSNFCLFPPLQQYGLLYRERMTSLGFDGKEMTTIVNVLMATSQLVGIVNGAMFRRFSFRQVALAGSFLCVIGMLCSAFCETFLQFIVLFSILYGVGLGCCMAAVSLAVNTYFKQYRRRATGFTWTITGLGPIIFPHIVTFLLGFYGMQGSILIFVGIALNAVVCAMTLQPVLWHSPKPNKRNSVTANGNDGGGTNSVLEQETNGNTINASTVYECKYCQYMKNKRRIFSSQYLFNNDDPECPGYEIVEPGTPMMARANDGWYGSKLSLTSEKGIRHRKQQQPQALRSRENLYVELGESGNDGGSHLYKPNYFNREREDYDRYASKVSVYSKASGLGEQHCTCAEEKALLQKSAELRSLEKAALAAAEAAEDEARSKMTFFQKFVKFFDLNLLRDFTFVNLVLGMSIMMFGEMNFSVLTPMILNSFGYRDSQISTAMSLLGSFDIIVRFVAPLALEKVKLGNRVLFAAGIILISIGRFVVTVTSSYEVILVSFVFIGIGKAFRTIFSPLILPSYVPLKRLPAASGLQLIISAIFSFVFGPILGMVTDIYKYRVTIHLINALTCIALLMWVTEYLVRRLLRRPPGGLDK